MELQNNQRLCPECSKIITHNGKSGKYACTQAKKKNQLCRSCRAKEISSRPEIKKLRDETFNGTQHWKDGRNPFEGCKHTEETKQYLSKFRKENPTQFTQEGLQKLRESNKGSGNAMKGKTVYGVWLEKYGKAEADRRDRIRREKWSKASSGKNNPMYGKPSPKGSGNGWKGWYKGKFFRSLRELSYLKYLMDNKIDFTGGESIKIPYVFMDKNSTYRPDFIVENKYMIELKPQKLIETPRVLAKTQAAIEYCDDNDLEYKIFDQPLLDLDVIIQEYENQNLKWMNRYEEKFLEYISN